jgi:hypothetical protein
MIVPQDAMLRVVVATWNLHGKEAPDDLKPWLGGAVATPDVYAIGTQEAQRGIEASVLLPSKAQWLGRLETALGPHYKCVGSQTLVAIHLAVFVRTRLLPQVAHVQSAHVSTGLSTTTQRPPMLTSQRLMCHLWPVGQDISPTGATPPKGMGLRLNWRRWEPSFAGGGGAFSARSKGGVRKESRPNDWVSNNWVWIGSDGCDSLGVGALISGDCFVVAAGGGGGGGAPGDGS